MLITGGLDEENKRLLQHVFMSDGSADNLQAAAAAAAPRYVLLRCNKAVNVLYIAMKKK